MKNLMIGLLMSIMLLGVITAKDKKKSYEERITALETQVEMITNAVNGPISDGLTLMDQRTLDLNDRLSKFEVTEDNKARADVR